MCKIEILMSCAINHWNFPTKGKRVESQSSYIREKNMMFTHVLLHVVERGQCLELRDLSPQYSSPTYHLLDLVKLLYCSESQLPHVWNGVSVHTGLANITQRGSHASARCNLQSFINVRLFLLLVFFYFFFLYSLMTFCLLLYLCLIEKYIYGLDLLYYYRYCRKQANQQKSSNWLMG